jgi:hypothetical protein
MVRVTDTAGVVHEFAGSNLFLPGAGNFIVIGVGTTQDADAKFSQIDALFANHAALKVEIVRPEQLN